MFDEGLFSDSISSRDFACASFALLCESNSKCIVNISYLYVQQPSISVYTIQVHIHVMVPKQHYFMQLLLTWNKYKVPLHVQYALNCIATSM